MRRFSLFITLFILILGLCGYYLGNRILTGSPMLGGHPTAVWIGVVAFLSFVLIGPMLSRVLPESFSGRYYSLRWMINMTMAIFFSLLFYTFVTDLSVYLLGFVLDPELVIRLQDWSLFVIAVLVAGTFLIGSLQALAPKVYRVDVPIEGLPTSFDGFKIAQISDLHIGEMIGHRYVRAVVEKTNLLDANIVAMTGDIIDGKLSQIAAVTADLAALKPREGVFYVTGNHEYYWGVENALGELKKAGARILSNENVRIRRGPDEIAIAGVPDISMGAGSDPARSVLGVPADVVKILLAHQPVSYRRALEAGVHLQLSGHTHGGQFFPWSLVVRLFQHYNKGLIRHGKMWIYVNRGTATWGPRLRFGIPPEITLLSLRRAGG